MQITVLSVTIEHMPGKSGGYDKAEVAYKDQDGKVSGKNLVSFNAPEAFAVIKAAGNGDVLDVVAEKDAKGYWQWVKVSKVDAATAAQVTSTPTGKVANVTPKSTYETPEERAQKQVYIIRQSSLTAAIATLKENEALNADDVITIAKQYEAYVFSEKAKGFADNFVGDEKDVIQ